MPSPSPQTRDPYAVLRLVPYRAYLLMRLFTLMAIQIQVLAVGWQVYQLSHDPLALGLIGLAEAVPAIGVALWAGHAADIYDRKRILLLSNVAFLICMVVLYVLSWDFARPWLVHTLLPLYGVIFASGIARGFFSPAASALVAEIVPRHLYGNSSAWNSSVWQGCSVAGPVCGGLLYGFCGVAATYLAAVVSLAIGVVFTAMITAPKTVPKAAREKILTSITAGLRFVWHNQIILSAMAMDLFAVFFGGAVALLPIFAAEVLHVGPQGLGLLRAAPGIGALAMAVYLAFRPITKGAGRAFLLNVAGFGICMITFALSKSFVLSILALALSGAFDSVSVFIRSTIYQLLTPNSMRGRVSAVNYIFIGSSNEIGEFESGVAAKLLGLIPSVIFGGSMTLIVVVTAAIKAPKLRQLDLSPEKHSGEG
jgi:MFS family permease